MYHLHVIALFLFLSIYFSEKVFVESSELKNDGVITDETLKKLLYVFNDMIGDSQDIPKQNIFDNSSLLVLNATLKNGAANFQGFNVAFAHVNMTTLEFHTGISYGAINLFGNYSLYVDNEYIHADCADEFSINTTDLSTDLCLKLKLTEDNTLQIEDIKVDFNASAKVDIKNLGGFQEVSDTLNKLINDILPDELISIKPEVQGRIVNNFKEMGNNFIFKNMTLNDLIEDINNLVSD